MPPVCVTAGQCGCVCVCFPRAPSSFTTAAFHRINIALHNPASVSARLDPLPQPRSTRSLYASNPTLPSNRVNFYPFSSAHSRVIGAPLTFRSVVSRWVEAKTDPRIAQSRSTCASNNVTNNVRQCKRYFIVRDIYFYVTFDFELFIIFLLIFTEYACKTFI